MYPKEMETGPKERDGEREGKSLAYERGSVRGKRFCVIINCVISTCTGNVLQMGMKKHLFDVSRTNKEISFLENRTISIYNFLERGIKNWPISRTGYQF